MAGEGGKERGEEEEGQGQRGGLVFGPRLGLGLSPGPSPIICLRRGLARIQKKCVREGVYLGELF